MLELGVGLGLGLWGMGVSIGVPVRARAWAWVRVRLSPPSNPAASIWTGPFEAAWFEGAPPWLRARVRAKLNPNCQYRDRRLARVSAMAAGVELLPRIWYCVRGGWGWG